MTTASRGRIAFVLALLGAFAGCSGTDSSYIEQIERYRAMLDRERAVFGAD